MIEEALDSKATGAGITGGDPLISLKRTVDYAKYLKKKFGESFHIHIYFPLDLVNKTNLEKLYKSGIDEVRFHPDFENKKEWSRIFLAKKFDWSIGVEIPVIPGKEKEIKHLIDFIDGKIDFLNLNELEGSDTNANKLLEKGFTTKNRTSYGVKGSEELAVKLLNYCLRKKINVHYCTGKLKDRIQLGNRIKIRASSEKKKYDKVTNEGILIRGAIYHDKTIPSFGYKKRIEQIKNNKKEYKEIIKDLEKIIKEIKSRNNLKPESIELDKEKLRILTSLPIIKKVSKTIKNKCAIVEEYPTSDKMEVELDFIN